MRVIILCGLVAIIAGCSAEGTEDDGSPNVCADRLADSYLARFAESSGNCGELPSVIISGDDQIPDGCWR